MLDLPSSNGGVRTVKEYFSEEIEFAHFSATSVKEIFIYWLSQTWIAGLVSERSPDYASWPRLDSNLLLFDFWNLHSPLYCHMCSFLLFSPPHTQKKLYLPLMLPVLVNHIFDYHQLSKRWLLKKCSQFFRDRAKSEGRAQTQNIKIPKYNQL